MPIPHGIDVCPFHFSLIGCFGLLRSIASSWRFRRRSYRHESSESVREVDSLRLSSDKKAVSTRRRQQRCSVHALVERTTDRDLSPTSHTSLGFSESLEPRSLA